MSRRNSHTPIPIPEKKKRITPDNDETRKSGIDSIVNYCVKTAQRAAVIDKTGTDLIDGAYGRKRIEALKRSFDSIISRYHLTKTTNGIITSAEMWAELNIYPTITLDDIERDTSLYLGAAIWFLDMAGDIFELEQLLSTVPCDNDLSIPEFYDSCHTEEAIFAAIYILKHRHKGSRFLDPFSEPGETADAFEKLISLIDPDAIKEALSATRKLFWMSTDAFFNVQYELGQVLADAIEAHNKDIDAYNLHADRMTEVVRDLNRFMDSSKKKSSFGSPMVQPPSQFPLKGRTGIPAKGLPNLPGMTQDFIPPELLSAEGNPFIAFEQAVDIYHRVADNIKASHKVFNEAETAMISFIFDYTQSGFSLYQDFIGRYKVALPIPTLRFNNPYALCAGLVLLCSPAVMRKIDAAGDLDLPWLTGAMCGVAQDIASHLPWGIEEYDGDVAGFAQPKKPLGHPDWYIREYQTDESEYKRSLCQILYETTGAILPRDMEEFDVAHGILKKYGIRGKNEILLTELMTVMGNGRWKTEVTSPVQEEEADSFDLEVLTAQVKELREKLKKATDEAHVQERRARKAEQQLSVEREKIKADRQELAGLREVVFKQQTSESGDERVSITLPYNAQSRIVIFGGHDNWVSSMKETLTGDVRFIDKDFSAFDTDIVKNADAVWFQTNCMSHKQYNKVMDAARKWNIPVQYFLYVSARKCAEQVAKWEE